MSNPPHVIHPGNSQFGGERSVFLEQRTRQRRDEGVLADEQEEDNHDPLVDDADDDRFGDEGDGSVEASDAGGTSASYGAASSSSSSQGRARVPRGSSVARSKTTARAAEIEHGVHSSVDRIAAAIEAQAARQEERDARQEEREVRQEEREAANARVLAGILAFLERSASQ